MSSKMRRLIHRFWVFATTVLHGQTIKKGSEIGQRVPVFSATDQNG